MAQARIYTKAVYDISDGTCRLIDSVAYDYEGPLALCGGKGSPPPPPDYAGAAREQGAANKEAAIASAQLSNPNITNPLGQQQVTYQKDPLTQNPVPYVNQTLSPIGQQQFDQSQQINLGLGSLAQTGLGFVQNTLDKPFNHGALPQATVNAGQTGQDAIMARLQPQIERNRAMQENDLITRGIRPGMRAYDVAKTNQGQQENDLYQQAGLAGISIGDSARSKAIQEQEFFRTEPLNVLNAVRSAAPVSMPQFQNYQGQNIQPAPMFNAAQKQYNAALGQYKADQASSGNFMNGLFSLGGAGIMKYSDRRLKSNIVRIGTHPLGIGLYEYEIFGARETGVMADEVERVMPQAVSEDSAGFKRVDYGMLYANA